MPQFQKKKYSPNEITAALSFQKAKSLSFEQIDQPEIHFTYTSLCIGVFLLVVQSFCFHWGYQKYVLFIQENNNPPPNLVILSIPIFFVAVLLEYLLSLLLNLEWYRFNDTFLNFACGATQQVLTIALKVSTASFGFEGYRFIAENFSITQHSCDSWGGFIATFIAVDFFYYWFHRKAHEIAFLWSFGHVVHHRSNEYNLSVALTQGTFQRLFSVVFYFPLAFFVRPEAYVFHIEINTVYQFWVHSRIGKLGILEWIFMTPSHHRVHHAASPSKYIDKNYGGTLVIWDRLFGTFIEEDSAITYGLVHPVDSWNPVWVNLMTMVELFKKMNSAQGFRKKIMCLWSSPGYNPDTDNEFPIPDLTPYQAKKYDSDVFGILGIYIKIHSVFWLGFISLFLFKYPLIQTANQVVMISLSLVYGLFTFGLILDRNQNALYFEIVRLVLFGFWVWICIPFYLNNCILILVISIFTLFSQKHQFDGQFHLNSWVSQASRKFKVE